MGVRYTGVWTGLPHSKSWLWLPLPNSALSNITFIVLKLSLLEVFTPWTSTILQEYLYYYFFQRAVAFSNISAHHSVCVCICECTHSGNLISRNVIKIILTLALIHPGVEKKKMVSHVALQLQNLLTLLPCAHSFFYSKKVSNSELISNCW